MASVLSKEGLRKNTFLIGVVVAIGTVVAVLSLMLLRNFIQTETYYTLNQDVPARTQVTPDMLSPVTTSSGTAPKSALGMDKVQSGGVYTQYSLHAGDILTMSNAGEQKDISVGIPDSWVVTNFSVPADSAVGGRIQRGYYFDIMVADASGSYYPFVNVLALDTTVDLNNASSSDAANTEEAYDGQTTQYVVGMSPQDAARLHSVMKKSGADVRLVLSPRQNEYNPPKLSDYDGAFGYNQGEDKPKDMGKGTDYTFTDLERDSFGRPVAEPENCSDGNSVISGDICKEKEENVSDEPSAEETTPSEEQ